MSPKLPVATAKEVARVAQKLGFEFRRQSGSHAIGDVKSPLHAFRTAEAGRMPAIRKGRSKLRQMQGGAKAPHSKAAFGGKHHTTVLHSVNKIESLRRNDKELARTINRLLDSLE